MKPPYVVLLMLLLLAMAPAGRAQLSKAELKEAKKLVAGPLYLRMSIPIRYAASLVFSVGRRRLTLDNLAEVSPTGSSLELDGGNLPEALTAKGVLWWFLPNDAVRYGTVTITDGGLAVSAEGTGPKADEVTVKFVNVNNLDEFKAAFHRTFSRTPLQDEHPEWPADIRKAIAERGLVEGMTPQQAYCVVGRALQVKASEENGKKLETWLLPQEIGIGLNLNEVNRRITKQQANHTGLPESLKFVDAKLVEIGRVVKPEPVKKK